MSKNLKSKGFFGLVGFIAALTLGVLILILGFILVKGVPNISWEFLSEAPTGMGREGGIFPIIVGTIYVTLVSIIIATPIGVAAAIYFSEYAKKGKLINIIRFFSINSVNL